MYGKLEGNKLIYAPVNYTTDDNLIINFNKDINIMKSYGYKEIIDIQPNYDRYTECLKILEFAETDDEITVNYKVEKIPQQEPSVEERISSIETLLLTML